MTLRRILSATLLFVALFAGSLIAADWRQFRGPGGLAASDATGLPVEWGPEKNLVWRTELPGLGTSSPITVGERIYLTCYDGYAEDRANPGDMQDLTRYVVCLDRASGQILWSKPFEPQLPESKYSGGNNSWHGYSSSTPASDGERLYVFFGKSGVYCLDLDGNQIWHAEVGSNTRGWGSANSPVLHGDMVIINASVESGSLVALDKKSGEEKWRAGGIRGSWNTPLLVGVEGGKTELVVSLPQKIVAYDPATGDELWTCDGIPDRGYVCPSLVAHGGVVYAIGGRTNTAIAVRAGGRGDVTDSHQLWRTGRGSNVTSPVYHDGHLYWVHERRGVAYCLNAKDGEVVYEERLSPRPGVVYASGIVADGKLYFVSQHNGTYVLAAKPEFELLAHNTLGEDTARANASPAISDGKLLLRNDKYLYCIGK